MALPALRGNVYTRDDLGAYHLPLRYFYSRQLAAGESFDWHPGLFGGFYLTGEGQLGSYHPWHMVTYRLLPLPAAFTVELLSSYAVLWGGMFVLVLRLAKDRAAAAWAALIFTFGGFSLLRFVHPNAVAVISHLPWLLWCEDRLLAEAARRTLSNGSRNGKQLTARQRLAWPWLGYVALTGSQWLLGYPQYVWYSLLAETAWFIVRSLALVRDRRSRRRHGIGRFLSASASLLFVGKAGGLALGAVQFLPTWEALHDSARSAPTPEFLATGSLHPVNLLQLVAPYLFRDRVLGGNTHEMGLYLGAAPLCLALTAWTTATHRRRERIILIASAVGAVLALLTAFGRYSPLFILQQWLPFRCPSRAVVLFQLCVVIAAAFGFRNLLRTSRSPAEPLRAASSVFSRTAFALAAASIFAVVLPFASRSSGFPWGNGATIAAGIVLFSTSALAITATARGHRTALIGLILLTAVDLASYGLSYAVWRDARPFDEWRSLAATPPLHDSQNTYRSGRVVFLPDAAVRSPSPLPAIGNECLVRGFRRMDGYAGLPPRRVLDMQSLAARRIAEVGWVGRFGPSSMGQAAVVWEKSPGPLPRFRTVGQVIASAATPEVIERTDSAVAAVVEKPINVSPEATARIRVITDRPGRMLVAVQASGPVLLVISEAYHPGWHAAHDGRAAEVLRVNGDFMGCVLPEGRHRLTLTFRPWSLVWGGRVSLCALTALATAFLAAVRQSDGRKRAHKKLD
ncbi:hypothetical protein JCM17478_08550 [Thermopirellula anaerolimosa]